MSFEISNHYEIIYNKEDPKDVEGKKKLSIFVKSLMVKFFDLAEGVYDNISLKEFEHMDFFEPKELTKEIL